MMLTHVFDKTRHFEIPTGPSDMSSKQRVRDTFDHIKVLMQEDCMWGVTSARVGRVMMFRVPCKLMFLTKVEGSRSFEACDEGSGGADSYSEQCGDFRET